MTSLTSVDASDSVLERDLESMGVRPPSLCGGTLLQGHLRALSTNNLALFQRCAALGGIVRFRVYWYECHVVSDPQLASELLVGQASAFKKTRALQVARPTFGDGLVTSEGDRRKRQQRMLSSFFTPRAVGSYRTLIERAASTKLSDYGEAAVVDLREAMIDISLDIVCQALFGIRSNTLKPFIRRAADAVQAWHSECQALCLPYPHYLPTLANLRYRAHTSALDREVYALIGDQRAQGSDQHGLIGALLGVRDEDGSRMDDREIRDHLVTLFLAGHDTTAAALAFALYELTFRPDLQQRIAAELEQGPESECLDHVIKETLRLYPPVHLVARTALRDVRLGQYLVRRGEEVVLPLSILHRNPSSFERPDDFWPERWSEASRLHRHAYLPFSAGPRVCIGQALAMAELRGVLGQLLRRCRLEPLAPRAPRLDNRLTLAPAAGSTRVRVRRATNEPALPPAGP